MNTDNKSAIGRNEPCPCGSGKKYKKCCQDKDSVKKTDILRQYQLRLNEIVGERTSDEKKYDDEVVRRLNEGDSIQNAIAKAGEKFPAEALTLNAGNLPDIQAHYDYLAQHETIMRKLNEQ